MKDQASVGEESSAIKYDRALALFTESVLNQIMTFVVAPTIKVVMLN